MHVLENEINKVKIQIPLLDLIKDKHFQDHIHKLLQTTTKNDLMDTINLQEDKPTILMGSHMKDNDETVPPFYVSLNIHDKVLHNYLLDSSTSHNLMPKVVME